MNYLKTTCQVIHMRCITIILLFLTCSFLPMQAQHEHEWEKYFVELSDVEDYDEEALSDTYDILCEMEENPLNINTAEFDDFSKIPGLSIAQISDIIEFRDRYGELKTMEELAMVPSIDRNLRLFLSCFFVASKVESKKWYSKEGLKSLLGRHDATVISSLDVPFYTRKGYETSDETAEKAYLGDKYRYNLKYTGKFSGAIKYGLVVAKDPGEPVFSHGNKQGMDYYSYYVSLQKLGRIRQIVVGKYRARFGMGLVLNTNSSFGKQSMLTNVSTVSNAVSGYSSRSEASYLRGVAGTVALGKRESANIVDFTAFYSYRNHDATLNDDGSISTVLSTGYHRTKTEMNKKDNTQHLTSGAHLAWKHGGWHAGITGVYDWFNRDLNPKWDTDGTKYRQYSARGNSFWNAGVDYGYISSRFSFTGETATGGCGAIATLNALQARVCDDLTLTAVQRFYSYKYYAIQSNSFSDGGKVQNESGFYLGARWNGGKYTYFDFYTDIAYSPWMKYQVHSSSYSWDNNVTVNYDRNGWNVLARYRLRLKQRDNSEKTTLADRYEHRGRLAVTRSASNFSLKTQVDASVITFEGDNKFGWMIGETAQYKFLKKLDVSVGISYFDTDSYDSRLYTYERSLLYSFSMPSYYGKGIRLSLVARIDLKRHWMLMGKLGMTKYYDRDEIGTANQMISASHQTDLSVQVRYKF